MTRSVGRWTEQMIHSRFRCFPLATPYLPTYHPLINAGKAVCRRVGGCKPTGVAFSVLLLQMDGESNKDGVLAGHAGHLFSIVGR